MVKNSSKKNHTSEITLAFYTEGNRTLVIFFLKQDFVWDETWKVKVESLKITMKNNIFWKEK